MKGMRNIAPFGLRMPDELREAVAERAKANGRSINSEIVQILEDALNSKSHGMIIAKDEAHSSSGELISVYQLEKIIEQAVVKALALTATPIKKPT